MPDVPVIRVARPTDNLTTIKHMYINGLGFTLLSEFTDHDGFDGVMLGQPNAPYHLEFTAKMGHTAGTAPTQDNLLVFYIPEQDEWDERCEQMCQAGFIEVPSFNPYWDVRGRTFEDVDGYRVVLQNAAWTV